MSPNRAIGSASAGVVGGASSGYPRRRVVLRDGRPALEHLPPADRCDGCDASFPEHALKQLGLLLLCVRCWPGVAS